MRKLHKQDIVEILYGATLLGAGGGGSLCFGLDMLKKLEKTGEIIELDLLELDEIGDDEYAAMVAGLGVPSRFMRKIVCRLRLSEVSRQ